MCCFAKEIPCCFGSVYKFHFQFCDAQPICCYCCMLRWFLGDLWVFSHHLGLTRWGVGSLYTLLRMDGIGVSPHAGISSCLRRRKKVCTKAMWASASSTAKVERGRMKLQHWQKHHVVLHIVLQPKQCQAAGVCLQ